MVCIWLSVLVKRVLLSVGCLLYSDWIMWQSALVLGCVVSELMVARIVVGALISRAVSMVVSLVVLWVLVAACAGLRCIWRVSFLSMMVLM